MSCITKQKLKQKALFLIGLLFILLVILIPLPTYTLYLELYGIWQYRITGQPFTPEQTLGFLAKQMNAELIKIDKYAPFFDNLNFYLVCKRAGFVNNKTGTCICDSIYLGMLSNRKYIFVCVEKDIYSLLEYVKDYKII